MAASIMYHDGNRALQDAFDSRRISDQLEQKLTRTAFSADDKELAINMRLVSLSFDPDYDTPQHLAEYSEAMRDEKLGCEWHFTTAKSNAALESILNGYGQAVDKRSNPNDPLGPLYHILRVFLIDRDGRIRNIYSSATLDPRLVLVDVKTLLLEEKRFSKQ